MGLSKDAPDSSECQSRSNLGTGTSVFARFCESPATFWTGTDSATVIPGPDRESDIADSVFICNFVAVVKTQHPELFSWRISPRP